MNQTRLDCSQGGHLARKTEEWAVLRFVSGVFLNLASYSERRQQFWLSKILQFLTTGPYLAFYTKLRRKQDAFPTIFWFGFEIQMETFEINYVVLWSLSCGLSVSDYNRKKPNLNTREYLSLYPKQEVNLAKNPSNLPTIPTWFSFGFSHVPQWFNTRHSDSQPT